MSNVPHLPPNVDALLELIADFPQDQPLLIGMDGYSATGKSTFAAAVASRLIGAQVITTDDFYLPESERLARFLGSDDPASAFDVQRLKDQVIRPFSKGERPRWQPYDWTNDRPGDWTEREVGGGLIIEGVTALHPAVRDAFAVKVWLEASRQSRLERMEARGHGWPRAQIMFWIAEGERYRERWAPDRVADLVFAT